MVPDGDGALALMLRDSEGVAPAAIMVRRELAPVVARFDGRRTAQQIATELAPRVAVDTATIERLAAELDAALFLDSPSFRAKKADLARRFGEAAVRPASHAGGAYHADPRELAGYLDGECIGRAPPPPVRRARRLRAVCAPHMDLWRAAVGYGHAYRALGAALADGCADVDTFFVLGTSHAPMRRPFAVCDKAFATPLGELPPDREAVLELSKGSRFDVFADAYNHKGEHSVEFQVVFLQHLLRGRPARIVPILCGLGDAQVRGRDPTLDGDAESFLRALTAAVAARGRRAMVVAGADLAHVGPRFGDPRPLDARERQGLEARDGATLERVVAGDARGFFEHAVADLDTRRLCGVGPIYTMIRALDGGTEADLLNYEQCVDPHEGSIVSHASLALWG